jgi:3-hydroxybutyryl-CoA dehydratase
MTNNMDSNRIRDAMERIDKTAVAEYVREISGDLIETFAEVSGDFHPLHVDAEYAKSTPWGRRIGHGAMLVGFMSTASTILSEDIEKDIGHTNVSLGYDRLRFIEPVFEGDTITTRISIVEVQKEKLRVICEERCTNQSGTTVAVGIHVMRFI